MTFYFVLEKLITVIMYLDLCAIYRVPKRKNKVSASGNEVLDENIHEETITRCSYLTAEYMGPRVSVQIGK